MAENGYWLGLRTDEGAYHGSPQSPGPLEKPPPPRGSVSALIVGREPGTVQ